MIYNTVILTFFPCAKACNYIYACSISFCWFLFGTINNYLIKFAFGKLNAAPKANYLS